MTRGTASDASLLAAVSSEALCAARWERIDLQTRRPDMAHDELLLARAAELAMSPIGRDQVMSLALEHVVRDAAVDVSLLEGSPPGDERARIAKRVFECGPRRAAETEALVAQIEETHARRLGREARLDLLAERIGQEATLQERLWDHPAIPANDGVRLAMLCSIPKLRDLHEALSGGGVWRALPRWFGFVNRGAR